MWRLLLIIFCVGCSLGSDDFLSRGEAIQRSLVLELRQVESVDQLKEAVPRLRRHFNDLSSLMIEARAANGGTIETSRWSAHLRDELLRLYQLEGAREVMESAQREALTTLHRAEQPAKRTR